MPSNRRKGGEGNAALDGPKEPPPHTVLSTDGARGHTISICTCGEQQLYNYNIPLPYDNGGIFPPLQIKFGRKLSLSPFDLFDSEEAAKEVKEGGNNGPLIAQNCISRKRAQIATSPTFLRQGLR